MIAAREPVTVTAVRVVPAARAAEFEELLRGFLLHAVAAPGNDGVQVLRRPDGDRVQFTIVAGFSSTEARRAFVLEPAYSAWTQRLSAFSIEPTRIEEQVGLGVWFASSPGQRRPVPVWKMAVVTWLGVNLVTTALLPFAPRLLGGVPFPWSNFLFNLPVVGLLAWWVMPALTRLLGRWLQPAAPSLSSSSTP